MRISTAADLGIRGMAFLAQNYRNGPVPMATICQEQGLPRQYTHKVFAALGRAGLVHTKRGKGGGFVLARPPADISILNIIEAIEGQLVLNSCQSNPPRCRWNSDDCPIRPLWHELQGITSRKLAEFRLDRAVSASP